MAQFISNEDILLSSVMENIIPKTEKLHFLVGYFYFSGFNKLYKSVKDKDLRILVGMNIEKDMLNHIKEFRYLDEIEQSRRAIKNEFNNSFINVFNKTHLFDNKEEQVSFKIFLNKIKDGTLEIRKTIDPNHAKVYLFESSSEHCLNGLEPGYIITGSSNLTYSGLSGRAELNVLSHDKDDYEKGHELFKRLWESAVEIVGKDSVDEFFDEVIKKLWFDKVPKPYYMYIRVLDEYFSFNKPEIKLPQEISKNRFLNLKYQSDAIAKAIDILNRHNGVIISDVVGLGKSIIASAIAHNLAYKTIIICPPHLKDQWDDYRMMFDFSAMVISSGKISDALNASLKLNDKKLIIVDEAHKYRNSMTKDYALLHQTCQGNKVILLSATPYNNRPQDVFNLMKLFQIPTKSTIQTTENLMDEFAKLIREYKAIQTLSVEINKDTKKFNLLEAPDKALKEDIQEKEEDLKTKIDELGKRIRDILSPVLIRRTRLDLKAIDEYRNDLEAQGIAFSKAEDPKGLEYDLGDLAGLYLKTLNKIDPMEDGKKGLNGARYKPLTYVKNIKKFEEDIKKDFGNLDMIKQTQVNLANFMRRLLVSRFESSIQAFRITIERMIESMLTIKRWHDDLGKIPIYRKGNLPDIDKLQDSLSSDTINAGFDIELEDQLKKYIEKGMVLIDKENIRQGFIEDLNRDVKLLSQIHKEWFGSEYPSEIQQPIILPHHDPKIETLVDILEEKLKENPKRKIIVFSGYADTINYLFDKIKIHVNLNRSQIKPFKYTSSDNNKSNKRSIKVNFDASYSTQSDDFNVLLATDAISEGFNLHRAGIVINYDIPYNPTRVIQRVGRINRIDKKVFDSIYIYNYFPTVTGESEIRIKQIAQLKFSMMNALLGEDTHVITAEDTLESKFSEMYKKESSKYEELSWDTPYRQELSFVELHRPEILKGAREIPMRSRTQRKCTIYNPGVVVFGKKGEEYIFKYAQQADKIHQLTAENAFKIFKTDLNENGLQVSDDFDILYQAIIDKLFIRKQKVVKSKGLTDATQKIEWIEEKNILPEFRDYTKDLLVVMRDLGALPDYFLKQIRAINTDEKYIKKEYKKLIDDLSHIYLSNMIRTAQLVNQGNESLILSEELTHGE